MKLMVGLGNPGRLYAGSRHNIGFTVLKALGKYSRIELKKERYIPSLSAHAKIKGEPVVLATPLTFMNLSGVAVAGLLKKYKVSLEDLLVVCDDLDLELGRMKLRPSGSSGGHRGLKSIIDSLESDRFARLRLGIGRPYRETDAAEYVLSAFAAGEKRAASAMVEKALDCCVAWVNAGMDETMNNFNKSIKPKLTE